MGPRYISYGITKSASTFAWQLIKRIAIEGGIPAATLTAKSKGANSPEDYIDPISEEKLRLIESDIGDSPVVIKTHGPATPTAVQLVRAGKAQVFASYRDLRDVALSLLDHAVRSRRVGIRDFAEFHELSDTTGTIEFQVKRFNAWVVSCAPLLIPYDEICFDTEAAAAKIAERLGVCVDVERICAAFLKDKSSIGQFNRGERRRFEREMDAGTSQSFVMSFLEYYQRFFPEEISRMEDRAKAAPNVGEPIETTLTELANRFRSDKGTQAGAPPHRYTYLYDLLFWPLKRELINFLELGLAVGGPEVGGPIDRSVGSPSIEMWLSYFPRANIFGFDISDFSKAGNSRFTFIRGDAGSEADLQRLAEAAPSFDVIVDDASHASYHQQLAFRALFPKLAPGGLYIIEDLHWQPRTFEPTLPKVPPTSVFLMAYFEEGKYTENSVLSEAHMNALKREVFSFASFGAFDGSVSPVKLIVIRKVGSTTRSRVTLTRDDRTDTRGPSTNNKTAVAELIGAVYNAVLARWPDASGLEAYMKAFKDVSLGVGLERTVSALIASKEFQSRRLLKALNTRHAKNSNNANPIEILFMQTADADQYKELLDLSSMSVTAYCGEHNFHYECFRGIVRGYYPWHATFNRIPLLYRLLENRFSGWVCYLDADAFVADLKFDLVGYLAQKGDVALIAAPVGQSFWWAVNAGVLLINLGHILGRALVREWYNAFSSITDDELRSATDWSAVPDDQSLLHQVLRTLPDLANHVVIDRTQPPLINYNGRFIRQILRENGSFEERAKRLRTEVSRVLEGT